MKNSKIIATGSYLPEKILTNLELEQMVATSDEWITSRTGIKQRRVIAKDQTVADLAYLAAMDAINCSGFDKNQIDLILVATTTVHNLFPSTACIIQERLGLNGVPAFDLSAACSGFIYGLTTADCYIKTSMAKTILLVGVDVLSDYIDYTDRNTCILFGDGAGAVILQATEEVGIIGNEIHADGSGIKHLYANGNIKYGNKDNSSYLQMNGQAVFKFAVNALAEVADSLLAKTKYTKDQIDWLIPHQANIRIIEATAKHLNISMDKVIVTVEQHANTSAASVPLALDYAVKNNKVKRGDILLLEGVGAGFTWGASLIKY